MAVMVQSATRRANWQASRGSEPALAAEQEGSAADCKVWAGWPNLIQQVPFVIPEAVLPDLSATTPLEAIQTLLGALVEAGAIPEPQQGSVLAGVLRREALGPTGIGYGIAIPHTKHEAVNQVCAAVGYCRLGINFQSLDEKPVHLVFLVVSPAHTPSSHLLALQKIARLVREQREAPGPHPD